jgi:fructokinase
MKLYGSIEVGGTKQVCMVGAGPQHVEAEIRFPTTTPAENIEQMIAFFRPYQESGKLAALGIGSFGPVDLNPQSPTYGYITTTPKPGWAQTDLRGALQKALGVPVAFDTDVNAAAFGEYTFVPENQGLESLVYMTVGTGIGVGAIINGRPLHGLVHPEAGHVSLHHDWRADPFEGVCPFHGDCFEGLCAGPALAKRWGQPAETLPPDHPAWDLEASYIAQALANLVYALSPQRIVLGGGVMSQASLFPRIRRKVQEQIRGYVQAPALAEGIDEYIVPPGLGNRSGVLGGIALAAAMEA